MCQSHKKNYSFYEVPHFKKNQVARYKLTNYMLQPEKNQDLHTKSLLERTEERGLLLF